MFDNHDNSTEENNSGMLPIPTPEQEQQAINYFVNLPLVDAEQTTAIFQSGIQCVSDSDIHPYYQEIHLSILDNDLDAIEEFYKSGVNADASIQHKYNFRALHFAKSSKAVELLVQYGANPNSTDRSGATALDWAIPDLIALGSVKPQYQETAVALIEVGADLDLSKYKDHPLIRDYKKLTSEFKELVKSQLTDAENGLDALIEAGSKISVAQRKLQYKKIIDEYSEEERGAISKKLNDVKKKYVFAVHNKHNSPITIGAESST